MIAVIGADLRRAHISKHKKMPSFKITHLSYYQTNLGDSLRCTACYLFALKKERDLRN
jgi:hypothetical protein